MVITEAKGSWIHSADGQKWLDFATGIGVVNLGHCHPAVVKAAQEQMGKVMHAQCSMGFHKPMLQLIEKLKGHLPTELNSFFFWNSGAEAVEAAIKLSRHATGRGGTVVVQGSYHGRTIGTMSMTTSKTIYSAGFGPLMPGVFTVPFPYYKQLGLPKDTDEQQMVDFCLQAFRDLLDQSVAPRDVSCFIMESVLGEGGYIAAPNSYIKGMYEICKQHDILFVIDDVQAGLGRAGHMFSFQRVPDFVPDILVFAKGIANGLPLSGIVSRKELMDKTTPGSMGGTYNGNAVACAAALAVLDTFEEEKVLDNVATMSKYITDSLNAMVKKYSLPIEDVRAMGLMVGVQFDDSCAPGTAQMVAKAALKRNMIMLVCSKYEVMRLIPALNISKEDMDLGLSLMEESFKEVFSK